MPANFLLDLINCTGGINSNDALWILPANITISLIDLVMKAQAFLFHSILDILADACTAYCRVQIQKKRYVWLQAIQSMLIHFPNDITETSAITLVCHAGIHKSVADDNLSAPKRRLNLLRHMLCAGSRID